MKFTAPVITLALATAAFAASAADRAPTNQISDAIAKLKSAANYSWTSTLKLKDSQFDVGPLKGQADKDGYAKMSQDFNGNSSEVVLKGDKIAVKSEDGWQISGEGGGGAFFALSMARNGAAANEAEITLKAVKDLKAQDGGVLSGDLTTEGATDLMAFGPRRAAGAAADAGGFTMPAPKNAKGSAKFWVKDGALVKYETHLQGTISFGDNENDMDSTRTVEITDVGTTKMDIPADAKKKLDGK